MPTPASCAASPVDVVLIVGGRWHDLAFAQAELLGRLVAHDAVRVRVREDFADIRALREADAVVAYTCDVRPRPAHVEALAESLQAGGRLLALHATHSAIDPPAPGGERVFTTPDAMPEFSGLLGSRFLAHPRIGPALIRSRGSDDPLVAGIAEFTTVDEVYVAELADDLEVLLETDIEGPCPGFDESGPQEPTRYPVLYRRRIGEGGIVYLTLGHCRGRFDVRDLGVDDTGTVDRRAWASAEFRELLDRCIGWAVHGEPTTHTAHLEQGKEGAIP